MTAEGVETTEQSPALPRGELAKILSKQSRKQGAAAQAECSTLSAAPGASPGDDAPLPIATDPRNICCREKEQILSYRIAPI